MINAGQSASIQLPPGPFINVNKLCVLIATLAYPNFENARGASCIVAKLQPTPSMPNHKSINTNVTDEDRRQFDALLKELGDELPEVYAGMPDKAIDLFTQAYLQHPMQLPWIPKLLTTQQISEAREKRRDLKERREEEIHQKILSKELTSFDKDHFKINQPDLTSNPYKSHLSRKDAIRYLDENHLNWYAEENQFILNHRSVIQAASETPILEREDLCEIEVKPKTEQSILVVESPENQAIKLSNADFSLNQEHPEDPDEHDSDSKLRTKGRKRSDFIRVSIETVQKLVNEVDRFDTHRIWFALIKEIKAGNLPGLRQDQSERHLLFWTKADGTEGRLNLDALRIRLYRLQHPEKAKQLKDR